MQRHIDTYGGAIAFVDDFTAWVTGPTAQSNREGINAIIQDALDWERRSGATFEAEKTAVIHFTRKAYKSATEPFVIKGQSVSPKDHVKILGVLMDARLKYHKHIARAAAKGLEAALARQNAPDPLRHRHRRRPGKRQQKLLVRVVGTAPPRTHGAPERIQSSAEEHLGDDGGAGHREDGAYA